MRTLLAAFVAICLAIPNASLGCTAAPIPLTPMARQEVEAMAARLWDRAASVQLVTITRTQAITYRDFYRLAGTPWDPAAAAYYAEYWGWEPVLRTFATSQRLKGQAPAEFTLMGAMQGYDLPPPAPGSAVKSANPWKQSERFAFERGGVRSQLSGIVEVTPANLGMSICETYLYGLAGQQFLVFLDNNHHLLREPGLVFGYITTPSDPWLAVVRQVAANRATGPRQQEERSTKRGPIQCPLRVESGHLAQ